MGRVTCKEDELQVANNMLNKTDNCCHLYGVICGTFYWKFDTVIIWEYGDEELKNFLNRCTVYSLR